MKLRWVAVAIALCTAVALVVPSVASAVRKPLHADLNGQNEVGSGDRNGGGSFGAVIDGNELCYGLSVRDIQDPLFAHIHRGRAGTNGDIVVTLRHPRNGDPGASSGCVALRPELRRSIRQRPSSYYVNVHTRRYQDGAIRGQLFSRGGD
jgi:CHRD domain